MLVRLFSENYVKVMTDIVEKILSGNKKYSLFLNDYTPSLDSLGEKFIELTSKFGITKRNDETMTLPTLICVVEVQEWVIDKDNPKLANKISDIDVFVID